MGDAKTASSSCNAKTHLTADSTLHDFGCHHRGKDEPQPGEYREPVLGAFCEGDRWTLVYLSSRVHKRQVKRAHCNFPRPIASGAYVHESGCLVGSPNISSLSTLEVCSPESVIMASYPTIPHNPLQQLHDLDKTSPRFHEQLRNFFHAYRDVWPSLQSDRLAWLVEYLDSVRLNLKAALLRAMLNMMNIALPGSPRCFRPSRPRIPRIPG